MKLTKDSIVDVWYGKFELKTYYSGQLLDLKRSEDENQLLIESYERKVKEIREEMDALELLMRCWGID